MAESLNRRKFLKKSVAASAAGALAMSLEEKALLAQQQDRSSNETTSSAGLMPTGKIGNVTISRLICGGNLLNGFAHARDLIYVSELLQHYFTDEKIMDTRQACSTSR